MEKPSVGRASTATGGFELHPLGGRGVPAFFLATRPSVATGELEARLKHAAARWALTPTHVDVLRRLALGDANKEIASRLQISARTVEEHVAVMIARAKVDGRLRLVARLWAGMGADAICKPGLRRSDQCSALRGGRAGEGGREGRSAPGAPAEIELRQ